MPAPPTPPRYTPVPAVAAPQTVTVTTDPDTFLVEHVFDLGHATTAYVSTTLLALAGDGETWGVGATDEGAPLVIGVVSTATISRDGSTYIAPGAVTALHSGVPFVIADVIDQQIMAPRYLKVAVVVSINSTPVAGNTYAGDNHPTATVQIDVEYL